MKSEVLSRRQILKGTLVTSGIGMLIGKVARAATCNFTPAQGEGPFYPEKDLNRDNDLTRLMPGLPRASGQVIYLRGTVSDIDCVPIQNALVEIWQAAHTGKYNHSEDPNQNLKLDPNFQYWGRTRTDQDGRYEFISIIPGHYPVGPNQYRPPHIHFKAHAAGFFSLTTQMYFEPTSYDDPKLAAIVEKLNDLENVNSRLKVHFAPTDEEVGAKAGEFDISLRRNG